MYVLNFLGQKVPSLVDREIAAGGYSKVLDRKDGNGKCLASGVYLYHMEADGFGHTKKQVDSM